MYFFCLPEIKDENILKYLEFFHYRAIGVPLSYKYNHLSCGISRIVRAIVEISKNEFEKKLSQTPLNISKEGKKKFLEV